MSNPALLRPKTFVCAAFSLLLAGCASPAPPRFKSTDINDGIFSSDFALPGHTDKTRCLADFRGKLVVVFFGFANCPDLRLTTLSTLAEVMKKLGKDAKTVGRNDHRRYREKHARSHVKIRPAFHPGFIGLMPSSRVEAGGRSAQGDLHLRQARPDHFYMINLRAASYVFDKQSPIRLRVSHEISIDDRVSDLRTLLSASQPR